MSTIISTLIMRRSIAKICETAAFCGKLEEMGSFESGDEAKAKTKDAKGRSDEAL